MMQTQNQIEVYYANRKGASISLTVGFILLGIPFIVLAISPVILFIMQKIEVIPAVLLIEIVLGVLTFWSLPAMRRIKWFLVAVNGPTITIREKSKKSVTFHVWEIQNVEWQFIKPRAAGKYKPLVQESLIINTAYKSFKIPHHYMNGYKEFLAYLQTNLAPEKFRKVRIDKNN